MIIKDLEPFTFNYILLTESLVQLEAFQCMKEKQTKFLPPLPEVPSEVPKGIPCPSAMVACEQNFLCRTPLAVLLVNPLGDNVQPSNVGQCLGEVGKRQMCISTGWGWVALNARKSRLGFPGWGAVMWELHFCPCSSPAVCEGIGALVLFTLPSGWAHVQLRVCPFCPSNNSHLNQIWENGHGAMP